MPHELKSTASDITTEEYTDDVTGSAGSAVTVALEPLDGDPDGAVGLVVRSSRSGVELSRLIPVLGSLGLWAIDEDREVVGDDSIHRLRVRRSDRSDIDVAADGPRVGEAVVALWGGRADPDRLNQLVTVAGLPWQEVAVLRAYRHYRRQIDKRYSSRFIDDTLVQHPEIAHSLCDLFRLRFGPGPTDPAAAADLAAQVAEACDRVARLDHDRVLRGMVGTIGATRRTNIGSRPDGPIALKFDSTQVPDIPRPVPYREIFVHGTTVEGVHLRAGPVARGGIRFSDRPEDLRTEVLDLMRTQVLKNALIVPTGAKGGFVLRGPSPVAGPERATTVKAAYSSYIEALLDVTDGADGEDPYLVVAADKGTAAFSDVANSIAVERRYWLGDAFASGGSVGYDHRALGVTARGAWVAISRHFRELYLDTAREPFSVAGIGDMSGDVFGNGMLLSDQIRLVAAFDHRDIFIDPDPDLAASLAERARLHELAGSSWQDFDRSILSEGGAVHSRGEKRIEPSTQAQAALRIGPDAVTPAELVQAILRAPVDLLYLGGIGTYVRASTEPDALIDDRGNSEVRIAADELRCRVVGEGANLGFTQRARIEYARRGGRINTDAIDNSAGVDTSDREVNIKILVDLAVESGTLRLNERAGLLASVTTDVVAAVLADSADQADGLRRARSASEVALDSFEEAQASLVAAGVLDAEAEALPSSEEYEARRRNGAGLTRPELAVLLAGAKRHVKSEVLASDLADDPAVQDALSGYFPPALVERLGPLLSRHRLRRELIASEIANDLVDHLGPSAVFDLASDSGVGAADVAAAYWVARGVAAAPGLWAAIAAAPAGWGPEPDSVGEPADPGLVLAGLLTRLTRAELVERRSAMAGGSSAARPHDLAERIAADRPVFKALELVLAELPRPAAARVRSQLAERIEAGGASKPLAAELALASELSIVAEVAGAARRTGRPVATVAGAHLELSDRLSIGALLARVEGDVHTVRPTADDTRWTDATRRGLAADLSALHRRATDQVLLDGQPTETDGAELARRWLSARSEVVTAASAVVNEVLAVHDPDLDALTVAVRTLRMALGDES